MIYADRKGPPGIGDPVEVRCMVRNPFELGRAPYEEKWMPATVVSVSPRNGSIGVAFSDGERLAVNRSQWRKSR